MHQATITYDSFSCHLAFSILRATSARGRPNLLVALAYALPGRYRPLAATAILDSPVENHRFGPQIEVNRIMSPVDDWRKLYPFRSHFLSLDGLRYHYVDEGQGSPCLLVHGNPTWSFYWRDLITGFRDRHRMVAPDHIGCGWSDKPAEYSYRLQQHIDNLCQLVETLDLRNITLLAHDGGGAIGLGAATVLPDRFERFVLFNTAAFRSQRMPWRIRACRMPFFGRLAVQGLNVFARAALHMATAQPSRLTPDIRAGLLAPYDSWAHRQAIYQFVQDIPLSPTHPSYDTLACIEQGLPALADRPTMLVWGMQDWCFTPHFLDRFLDFFPQADVRRLTQAGHYVVQDAADEVKQLVDLFLAQHTQLAAPKTFPTER